MADQGLDLTTYLAELEQQHASLAIQIAGVRARLGLAVDAPPVGGMITPTGSLSGVVRESPVQGRIRADEFFGLSIPEAIKAYLAIMKQPQSPKAIVDGLTMGGLLTNAKFFYANVTTALKRLRASGQVALTPNGWGLAAWYPNRAKTPAEPKKGKGKRRGRGKSAGKRAAPRVTSKLEVPAAHGNGGSPKKGANEYRAFMSERRKAGKSMAEVAVEWKARKAANN
jgi:hypothetical protein